MRWIKIAGLTLASMLTMGMALAGTASAAGPLWLLCLPWNGTNPTRYTTDQCRTATSSTTRPLWESVAIGSKSDTVDIVAFTLRLEDTKGELGAAVRVKCDEVSGGEGLISNRNLLLVFEAKAKNPETSCEATGTGALKVCKKAETVEGIHLPWRAEVTEETEGKYISTLHSDGNGEPGWKVRCSGVEDTCTAEASHPVRFSGGNVLTIFLPTLESQLLVFAEFLKNTGECTVGGVEAGNVTGLLAILLYTGLGLSLAP